MKAHKYEINEWVTVNDLAKGGMPSFIGRKGQVHDLLIHGSFDYELDFGEGIYGKFKEEELDGVLEGDFKSEYECEWVKNEVGRFEKIATELGRFTDNKNKLYGSSVDATYEMMKVLLDRYTYDDESYLIPKSLVKHMLLQVRIMDKQNRIFNNPSGKGDSESPYNDIGGYSLIGIDMVESIK